MQEIVNYKGKRLYVPKPNSFIPRLTGVTKNRKEDIEYQYLVETDLKFRKRALKGLNVFEHSIIKRYKK